MDRTTLTAAFKPLEKRGLVASFMDAKDGRARRLKLTDAGRKSLMQSLPVWRVTHDGIDSALAPIDLNQLRNGLVSIAG